MKDFFAKKGKKKVKLSTAERDKLREADNEEKCYRRDLMLTFEEYTLLNEVGNSVKSYAYKERNSNSPIGRSYKRTIEFETSENIVYFASFQVTDRTHVQYWHTTDATDYQMEISFGVISLESIFAAVDKGLAHAFSVMGTITTAAKKYANDLWKNEGVRIKYITFAPTGSGKTGMSQSIMSDAKKKDQRAKLYIAFIKKAIPGAKVTSGKMHVQVTLPETLFK